MNIEDHRKFDAVTLVAADLSDSLAASPPDLYVLAGALGRARRLSETDAGTRLFFLVEQARTVLSEAGIGALRAFEAVDGDELLEVLTDRLADDDETPDTLLSVLFDLDEWACAAATLGVSERTEDVMADARALVEDFATAASVIAPVATRLMNALRVTQSTPASGLWAAVAAASATESLDADVSLTPLPGWLVSRIDRAIRPTRPPIRIQRPAFAERPLSLAADDGSTLLPPRPAVSIAQSVDPPWELCFEFYLPFPEVAIYGPSPEQLPPMRLRTDTGLLAAAVDTTGCRATLTLETHGPWVVEIAGEVIEFDVEPGDG